MIKEQPPIDALAAGVVAIAELYAGIAMDEALAAELRALGTAPDRAPLWPLPYDV